MTDLFETLDVDGDFEAVNDLFEARGMGDGLPIVPPTRARVEAMLAATARDPGEVLGLFPPAFNDATVATIAVNAVMAGCRPEHFAVVLAAIEAMLDPTFNLYGINATTHPVCPLLIVSGPVVARIGLNHGYNVFGQGWRANATIGRAVRLAMVNVGGGRPGEGDRATHGHPGKYSYCIAEDATGNPWVPLSVQRGFDPGQSVVTIFGADAPHEVNDHTSGSGRGVLDVTASVFATLGNNNAYFNGGEMLLVMGPEHAHRIARDGWTLDRVREYLFKTCRLSSASLKAVGKFDKLTSKAFDADDDEAMVPMMGAPEDMLIAVAGGAGQHSMAIHSFGMTRAVSRLID
jgi:hypothetical protein